MLKPSSTLYKVLTNGRPRYYHATKQLLNTAFTDKNHRTITYTPPDLSAINSETWPGKYPREVQEEIKEYIDWKMTGDWKEMSTLDKQVSYFLAFGEYGPRAKNGNNQTPMERLFETIYKSIIFGTLTLSVYQLFKDKKLNDKIDYLEQQL